MLTVYGLSHCTTTKKAIKYLENQGIKVDRFIDIRDNPPNKAIINLLLEDNNGSIKKIINTSGDLYRSMNLKEKLDSMTVGEIVKLLTQNGMLIKRPLITNEEKATVSAKEQILQRWI
ncbi:Spx/MgsR family RNA polymerase-binding regulatory protein [Fundicoccus sp. Sow4_H7]|uniref:Spx/MgsR family RNA polymerase-binding regulatory protein n=1 Tax=Fundicoccus sp. Sow4_H7 TaxID=3438784 RepID=UPI003F91FDDA